MRIWLVNPFDPLPGEQEQLGRYARLAQAIRERGHECVWWSSTFSHRFKRMVDPSRIEAEAAAWGIRVELLPTRPYQTNVSIARLRNHRHFAIAFAERATQEPLPDVILASSPPLEAARAAVEFAHRRGIPSVIDIQDQWPDNFAHVMPKALRPLKRLLLAPWYRHERIAYSLATSIVGVAQGYVDRGVAVGGAKASTAVFPLGVDLIEFDAAVARGRCGVPDTLVKPPGETWLVYSGSLSHSYDVHTILEAARLREPEWGTKVRFLISGSGELESSLRGFAAEHNLSNVTFLGYLPFDQWSFMLSQCDVGLNASFPHALIYMPNKLFYYAAAGLVVLNTIPGECAELIESSGFGCSYQAGNAADCAAVVRSIVEQRDGMDKMRSSARRAAERDFDRAIISRAIVAFLEALRSER